MRFWYVKHNVNREGSDKPTRAFSCNFGNRPLTKIGKNDQNIKMKINIILTSKLGKINDIGKGSKIYP